MAAMPSVEVLMPSSNRSGWFDRSDRTIDLDGSMPSLARGLRRPLARLRGASQADHTI
jgi:hypothetical protein